MVTSPTPEPAFDHVGVKPSRLHAAGDAVKRVPALLVAWFDGVHEPVSHPKPPVQGLRFADLVERPAHD
jgi:hypothetical protein